MNEVISYVDVRAEEVAAAKADDVLEPAEQAKDDAIAAKEAAEQARDTTLAALPQIQQDITDLKAEDVALDGRLDNVELKVTTAEGNIVTIQGRVTAVETKNSQQDSAIAALQTADGQNVKINRINDYAVGLTGNQAWTGVKLAKTTFSLGVTSADVLTHPDTFIASTITTFVDKMNDDNHNQLGSITRVRNQAAQNYLDLMSSSYGYVEDGVQKRMDVFIRLLFNDTTGEASLLFYRSKRNADGTGTADTRTKTLASISASGVIS